MQLGDAIQCHLSLTAWVTETYRFLYIQKNRNVAYKLAVHVALTLENTRETQDRYTTDA